LAKDTLLRDVSFVVRGGATLDAHKLVLSVQSPVLRKMLASNMVESTSGRIELLDVDPKAMEIFVNSLYNIDIPHSLDPDIWEAVFWLFEKYQVYFPIPKLMKKIPRMHFDEIFPRLFDIFRKIPRLERYFEHHKNEIILAVLKTQPKCRTQAMQDYLLGAHYC